MMKQHEPKKVGPYHWPSSKEVIIGTSIGQESGAAAGAMEGYYLLAYSLWLAHPAFL